MLTIQLNSEVEKILARRAKRAKKTPEEFARRALLAHLEDLDDNDWARRAIRQYERSNEKLIPHEEVMKQFGLDSRIRSTRAKAAQSVRPTRKKADTALSGRKNRAA